MEGEGRGIAWGGWTGHGGGGRVEGRSGSGGRLREGTGCGGSRGGDRGDGGMEGRGKGRRQEESTVVGE